MPSKHAIALDADVLSVLNRSTIDATSLKLPDYQENGKMLDRGLYIRVNKVIEAAGGKWNRKAKAHLFASDPREALGLAVASGEIIDQKKARQQFFTPHDLAWRLAELACVTPGMRVLEPSAGEGAIAEVLRGLHVDVTCCENDPQYVTVLQKNGFAVWPEDFLSIVPHRSVNLYGKPDDLFDAIVMNPPFTKGQDIKHVIHALTFLRPDGRLVSVMSAGVKSNSTKAAVSFRELVAERGGWFEDVEEGAFKESGTMVRTVIVIIPGR